MEKKKRTIITIASVIALAMAILVCGVLLGCGLKQDLNEEDEYDPDGVILIPPSAPSTGAYLSIGIEEMQGNSIDDVSIDIFYGFDVEKFNGFWGSYKNEDEEYKTKRMCVIAYDTSAYPIDKEENGEKELYDVLMGSEAGDVGDGVILIDEISYTEEQRSTNIDPKDVRQCLFVNNLSNTGYECKAEYTQMSIEVVYKAPQRLKLSRELFTGKSGTVIFQIVLLMESNEGNVHINEISSFENRARIEYNNHDDQIDFISVRSGEKYRVIDNVVKSIIK